jgi:cob(I)alamin adenosyltransferase
VREARRGLALAQKIIGSGKYDVVILDELLSAVELNLLTEAEVLKLIKSKPPHLHLVYTGHKKFPKIIAQSDLATEMRMVKHPYYKGVVAQRGIDF